MESIKFHKVQASGNDFILIDKRSFLKNKDKKYLSQFAKKYCLRKQAIGADGMLVIEPSKKADFKMRIFNADGSEAEMCGNGARCVVLWKAFFSRRKSKKKIKFDTKAGIIEAELIRRVKNDENVSTAEIKVKVTESFGLKENIPVTIMGRKIKINFINTGVPHVVIFTEGLTKIDVEKIGRLIRRHKKFMPEGTNVNFIEPVEDGKIKIRTYERGVEAETLACGTGSIAAAIIYSMKIKRSKDESSSIQNIKIQTKGGETLKASFKIENEKIEDVWLEGKASCIYQGQIAVK